MTIISAVAGFCTAIGSAATASSGVFARLISDDLASPAGTGVVARNFSSVVVVASSFLFGLHSVRVTIPSARFSNEAALNFSCMFYDYFNIKVKKKKYI